MIFAYADPPYVGQARKHYQCAEVDHVALIDSLVEKYPDGWALSCSSPSLRMLLALCPDDVRVMAWVKPFCAFKVNVNPAYAWEPVIVRGGRKRTRQQPTVRDWVSANITLKKGLAGAKPEAFSRWLMEVLNVQAGDEFHDLFPGTGAVSAVAQQYCAPVSCKICECLVWPETRCKNESCPAASPTVGRAESVDSGRDPQGAAGQRGDA